MPTYRLTERIEIQEQTATLSDFEGTPAAWESIATAWAAIWPLTAAERVAGLQVGMEADFRCVLRMPGVVVTEEMQVVTRYGVLQIAGVSEVDGRGEYLELLLRKG